MALSTSRVGAASHRIAASLRDDILTGKYSPGERIIQEELAEQFGASRLPVREALRMLEADGLVTLVAHTGAWVSRLSLAECEELYQIRERVEPLLLRCSLPNLTDTDVERLAELTDRMQESRDVEEFLRLDKEFHLLSYSGAETARLGDMVQSLWNTTSHYRRAYTRLLAPDGNRTAHFEHHLLTGAIAARDSDDAERVLYGHIRRTRRELARHPEVFD
jgi:DNA-binding GntR family transcriptional regulator